MSSDVINVDAEIVMDTALSKPDMPEVAFHPASIEADFDAMLSWATALKTVYQAAEFSEDEQGYREAKAARAAIRTYARDIDSRRKAVKAEYSAPLVAFEERVKLVTSALGDAADACDTFVKGWEDAGRECKYRAIEHAYIEFAPLVIDVLPFRRFYDLMQQRGRKWANKTPSLTKCIEEMQEDVQRIADDLEAVKEIQTGHPDVAERTFWQTLDLAEARRQARAADEEDERIEALKARQEEIRRECLEANLRRIEATRKALEEQAEERAQQAARMTYDVEGAAYDEPPEVQEYREAQTSEPQPRKWVLCFETADGYSQSQIVTTAKRFGENVKVYEGDLNQAFIAQSMEQ